MTASNAIAAVPTDAPFGRKRPFPAPLVESRPLNKPGSQKDTRHLVFDLTGSGLTYNVGDSLGVFPENCPDTVRMIATLLNATGDEPVTLADGATLPLRDALARRLSVAVAKGRVIDLLARSATDPDDAATLREFAAGTLPAGHHVVDLLHAFPSARPPVDAFVAALPPLAPRLYSIASSPLVSPGRVHLTVAVVRYFNARTRLCKGVASTYLAERVAVGETAPVFVHAAHAFAPPTDGATPIVMIGPGTGVAPFREFLQHRQATAATGDAWLFFGDQRRAFDFLYEDEFDAFRRAGTLTRLDAAFSRDQPEKVYVQHRMLDRGPELWRWIDRGAHVYVCGDATRMAKDVDATLRQVVAEQGGLTADAANAYVDAMKKTKRYQRDVY